MYFTDSLLIQGAICWWYFCIASKPHLTQTPEPQGVLCGGVWTLRSHDCKMLCSSLLNYTCQSLIDCPFVCLSSVPGSAAIIPLWIRRLLILRQWNVIPWLSFFYLFFSFGLGDYLLFGNDLQTSTVQWHPENIKLYLPHMCHYRATSGFSIWQPLLQVHIVASPECLRVFFVILISVSCTINNTLLYYLVQSVTLVLDQL